MVVDGKSGDRPAAADNRHKAAADYYNSGAVLCALQPIQNLRHQKPVVNRCPYLANVTKPSEMLAAMKIFGSVMPMFSGGNAQERPEAAFLRVVETVVKRLCCIGELFQLGRARRKAFGALL